MSKINFLKIAIAFLVLALIGFGCAGKKVKIDTSDKNKNADETIYSAHINEQVAKQKSLTDSDTFVQPLSIDEPDIRKKDYKKNVLFKEIYFDFDSSVVKQEYRDALETYVNWLKQNSDTNVLVEGHTDDRGSVKYNLALGQERASKIRAYLSYLDISADRIATISYGEEKPVDKAETEEAWAKNRRAEFLTYTVKSKKDLIK